MEQSTQALLRKAAIEALTSNDDKAALEILQVLNGWPPLMTLDPVEPEPAIPAASHNHDESFWRDLILDGFIPSLCGDGPCFSIHMVYRWIQASGVAFTSGDLKEWTHGVPIWQHVARVTLEQMADQHILERIDPEHFCLIPQR